MKFERIKVIVDTHSSLTSGEIKIHDRFCFLEPTDIQSAEMFEDRLTKCRIPYVLAQVEVELPACEKYPEGRWKRGYSIFTQIRAEAEVAIEMLKEEIVMKADGASMIADETEVA
jgi:hypothetical protein